MATACAGGCPQLACSAATHACHLIAPDGVGAPGTLERVILASAKGCVLRTTGGFAKSRGRCTVCDVRGCSICCYTCSGARSSAHAMEVEGELRRQARKDEVPRTPLRVPCKRLITVCSFRCWAAHLREETPAMGECELELSSQQHEREFNTVTPPRGRCHAQGCVARPSSFCVGCVEAKTRARLLEQRRGTADVQLCLVAEAQAFKAAWLCIGHEKSCYIDHQCASAGSLQVGSRHPPFPQDGAEGRGARHSHSYTLGGCACYQKPRRGADDEPGVTVHRHGSPLRSSRWSPPLNPQSRGRRCPLA